MNRCLRHISLVLLLCFVVLAALLLLAFRNHRSHIQSNLSETEFDALKSDDMGERQSALISIYEFEKSRDYRKQDPVYLGLVKAIRQASQKFTPFEIVIALKLIRVVLPPTLDESAAFCVEQLQHPFLDIQLETVQTLDALYTNSSYELYERERMMQEVKMHLIKFLQNAKPRNSSAVASAFNMLHYYAQRDPNSVSSVIKYLLGSITDNTVIYYSLEVVCAIGNMDNELFKLIVKLLDPKQNYSITIVKALVTLNRCSADLSGTESLLVSVLASPSRDVVLSTLSLICQNSTIRFDRAGLEELTRLKARFQSDAEVNRECDRAIVTLRGRVP